MRLSAQLRKKASDRLALAQKTREKALNEDRPNSEEELAEITQQEEEAAKFEKQAAAADANERQQAEYSRGTGTGGAAAGTVSVHDNYLDDPRRGFTSHREFLTAVTNACLTHRAPENLRSLAAGADEQGVYSDPNGGWLVPVGFSPDMLTTDINADPVGGRTRTIPLGAPSVEILARVDKAHNTSVAGGLTVSRRAETSQIVSSRQNLEKVRLDTFGLFGLVYETEELISRSMVSFIALIEAGFKTAFADRLTDERLTGTGVGQYLGVMNSPALVSVAKEAAQATNTVVYNNILRMRARIYGYQNAIWMANPDTLPQIATLSVPVGTAGGNVVWMPSAQEDKPDLLLGRPIIWTEYMQTCGTQGDLALINWNEFLEGVYQPMQTAESIHVRFETHERVFKFWTYNAGQPWWKCPITPKRGANTISPFVTLDARP